MVNPFKQFITSLKKTKDCISRTANPVELYISLIGDWIGFAAVCMAARSDSIFAWLIGAIIALEMLGDLAYHRIHFEIKDND